MTPGNAMMFFHLPTLLKKLMYQPVVCRPLDNLFAFVWLGRGSRAVIKGGWCQCWCRLKIFVVQGLWSPVL